MIERFHGIDRHKRHWTISVLNREGSEIDFKIRCQDPQSYIDKLGPEDAAVMESGTGAFYWADKIQLQDAKCYIIDPYRFRIIKDSWNKTDKNDSRNMAKALWVHLISGEFGLPTVYKPSVVIRELRKYFCQRGLLNRQICMMKNNIQSVLQDNGIVLPRSEKERLLNPKYGLQILGKLCISQASKTCIEMILELLWKALEQKERIGNEILLAGEELEGQVELLISIRGITPLTALAFLADVADIKRFKTVRKLNSYLGLVPKLRESGNTHRSGHINRASRSLTRTILTQSLLHISEASPHLSKYYHDVKERRGAGRSRIALIRKVCGTMRRMLLNNEPFQQNMTSLYELKRRKYQKTLTTLRHLQNSA